MARRPPHLVAFVEVTAAMGGVEFSTLFLAQALDPARFGRLVICPAEGDLTQQCRAADIVVEVIPRARLFSSGWMFGRRRLPNPLAWLANLPILVVAAWRLVAHLRRLDVDLVCTKGLYAHFYGGLAARWAGLPCVWHVQDLVSERVGGLYQAAIGLAGRALAAHVIADGAPIAAQFAPYLPAWRVSVVHNGVDVARFSPKVDGSDVRATWGVGSSEVLVGNVARLTLWKGQDHLLRAFANLAADFPLARLVLVGAPVFDNDVYERELRKLVQHLGLEQRVIFAGYRWDLPEVLAALDIFVHASIEKDTSPLAVVSAMAAGKALVSTSVPGVVEILSPGQDALLVPPADAPALARALRCLLADPPERARLGRNARLHAEKSLSLEAFASQCQAIFARVLNAA